MVKEETEYKELLQHHQLAYRLSYNIEHISWFSFQTLNLSALLEIGFNHALVFQNLHPLQNN